MYLLPSPPRRNCWTVWLMPMILPYDVIEKWVEANSCLMRRVECIHIKWISYVKSDPESTITRPWRSLPFQTVLRQKSWKNKLERCAPHLKGPWHWRMEKRKDYAINDEPFSLPFLTWYRNDRSPLGNHSRLWKVVYSRSCNNVQWHAETRTKLAEVSPRDRSKLHTPFFNGFVHLFIELPKRVSTST